MLVEVAGDDLKELGRRIRARRKELGFSQEAFALSAEIDRSYVGGVERGERNVTFIGTTKSDGQLIWPQITMDIIPGLLGLGLGATALMLSFSGGKFLEAIRQNGKDNSYLRKVMASFFHFALINIISLIIAIIGKAYDNRYVALAGVFFGLYGLLLTMGIVSRIWHTARIYNKVVDNENGE